jgi:hypothetical protein
MKAVPTAAPLGTAAFRCFSDNLGGPTWALPVFDFSRESSGPSFLGGAFDFATSLEPKGFDLTRDGGEDEGFFTLFKNSFPDK